MTMTVEERVGDGIFVVGTRGVIADVDDAACDLLGYARDELVGIHGGCNARTVAFSVFGWTRGGSPTGSSC